MRVINWFVALIIVGIILYDKNSGPRTMPPAIPVHPHKIAAIAQKRASFATSLMLSNLWSFLSKL